MITADHGVKLSSSTEFLYNSDIRGADTGASCHITNFDSGAVLTKDSSTKMRSLRPSLDASENEMRTSKIIDITARVLNYKTKQKINITMVNCRFEESKFNLCSLIKMTGSGWRMAGDTTGIYLRKGKRTIHFNILIQTPEGRIWAIQMDRIASNGQEVSLASPLAITIIEMNTERAHCYCRHNSI